MHEFLFTFLWLDASQFMIWSSQKSHHKNVLLDSYPLLHCMPQRNQPVLQCFSLCQLKFWHFQKLYLFPDFLLKMWSLNPKLQPLKAKSTCKMSLKYVQSNFLHHTLKLTVTLDQLLVAIDCLCSNIRLQCCRWEWTIDDCASCSCGLFTHLSDHDIVFMIASSLFLSMQSAKWAAHQKWS